MYRFTTAHLEGLETDQVYISFTTPSAQVNAATRVLFKAQTFFHLCSSFSSCCIHKRVPKGHHIASQKHCSLCCSLHLSFQTLICTTLYQSRASGTSTDIITASLALAARAVKLVGRKRATWDTIARSSKSIVAVTYKYFVQIQSCAFLAAGELACW